MTYEERTAEVLRGLRSLRQNPSFEAAQDLLKDWELQREMYDRTDCAWRPAQCSGMP